jgi:integrase
MPVHRVARADHETRTIPIPPELVKLLRAHMKRYGTTPDGRIFQTAPGGILQDSVYGAVWTEARKEALTRAQCRSPPGRRPYDLRHSAANKRITDALGTQDTQPQSESGDKGDGDSEQAS